MGDEDGRVRTWLGILPRRPLVLTGAAGLAGLGLLAAGVAQLALGRLTGLAPTLVLASRPAGGRRPGARRLLGSAVPGLGPWACPRASPGSLRGRGGGCHLRTGTGAERRAAGRRDRSRPGGEGASVPAPRPETNKSRGRALARLRLALPGCPGCDHSRSPVPQQHACAIAPAGMPSSV